MKLLCTAACSLVLGPGGDVERRAEPGLPAADPVARAAVPPSQERTLRTAARAARVGPGARAAAKRKPGVVAELRRLRDEGAIAPERFRSHKASFKDAKRFVRRASGRRRLEMRGVVRNLQGIAARGDLDASRLPSLWLGLQRNREWWGTGPLLSAGQRVSFAGSEVVFQYFPGQGLQFHPLANFGKLNALWRSRDDARMQLLYDELTEIAADRAGGIAWEYAFWFGGGRPPWVSGMAQGTGVQAISRAAQRIDRWEPGRKAAGLAVAKEALGVFRTDAPEGVRRRVGDGSHYLLYSHSPRLYVINGFLQAITGLHEYARISGDPEGVALFEEGERRARAELPRFDTGAWSLYARGSSTSESSLHYHQLTRDFLRNLCSRVPEGAYCDTRARFDEYLRQPPGVALRTTRLRGGRNGRLRFDLSKISRVSLRVARGSRTLHSRSGLTLGRGTRVLAWKVPRRAGPHEWSVTATDLAGNTSSASGAFEVLEPVRKRRKRG
jgi:hypothetical protein